MSFFLIASVIARHKIDLSDCKLYVLRVKWQPPYKKELMIANSRPCRGCTLAIKTFNIRETIYTTDYEYDKNND